MWGHQENSCLSSSGKTAVEKLEVFKFLFGMLGYFSCLVKTRSHSLSVRLGDRGRAGLVPPGQQESIRSSQQVVVQSLSRV